MAAIFDGGVVLGADTRTTRGVYVANRTTDKINSMNERIFTLRSGTSSHTQNLERYARYYLEQHGI